MLSNTLFFHLITSTGVSDLIFFPPATSVERELKVKSQPYTNWAVWKTVNCYTKKEGLTEELRSRESSS